MSMRHSLCAVAALVAGAALSGCASADSETPADPTALNDKTYSSTDGTDPEVPGGGPLVLKFSAGRVSANAGCNGHGGTLSFDGDTMTAGPLMGTMMACPPPRDRADKWVSDLFSAPLTWRLDGTRLRLSRGEQTVVLTEQQDSPVTTNQSPTATVGD